MAVLQEFKTFVMRGNVMDLAIGVVIGGAFGKIVSSLVNDVIMPPLGVLLGGVDFTALGLVIKEAVLGDAGEEVQAAVTLSYGNFIQATVNFLIIAFAIFVVIKAMNRMKRKEVAAPAPPPAEPSPSKEELLLTEIRDLLKRQ